MRKIIVGTLGIAAVAAAVLVAVERTRPALADAAGRDLVLSWGVIGDTPEATNHGVITSYLTATASSTNIADRQIVLTLLAPANSALDLPGAPTEDGLMLLGRSTLNVVPVPSPDTRATLNNSLWGYPSASQFTVKAVFKDAGGIVLDTKTQTFTKP